MILKKKGMICFIRGRKKSSKLRNSSRYLIMPSSKEPKTPTKMKVLDKIITCCPRFLEFSERHVFRLLKLTVFEGVFFFFTKERPILTALKQMNLDEIQHSKGIKPRKNQLFHEFF